LSTRGAGVSAHIILRSTGEKERKKLRYNIDTLRRRGRRRRGGRGLSLNYNGAGERINVKERKEL
jgi:hypothetical protein